MVIGGGFGGTTAARFLRRADPHIDVVLLEPNATFIACPFSNEVITGERDIDAQRFTYQRVAADGVRVVQAAATAIDPTRRSVTFGDNQLTYDRLILSPGIDIAWGALPGYDETAAERMPHAWKAGEQTLLLRRQLEAMPDGGVVVISAPANPYRCPPGPYERASLIAHYLKTHKPRSKVILLDAKDIFSKQKLFQAAWQSLYPGLLEWVSLSDGGKVTRVDPATNTFETDFDSHKADVGNVIPPQRAGAIAAIAGVADRTGWCPIDPATFESKLQPGIHVIGDAAIAGAMPEIRLRRECPGEGLRGSRGAAPRRQRARRTAADQHLLQPGGAWRRDLGRRRVSSGERPAYRYRRCRRRQSAGCASRTAHTGSRLRRCLVQDDHRSDVRLMRWHCC